MLGYELNTDFLLRTLVERKCHILTHATYTAVATIYIYVKGIGLRYKQ